jgi:hypothetical protein
MYEMIEISVVAARQNKRMLLRVYYPAMPELVICSSVLLVRESSESKLRQADICMLCRARFEDQKVL